MNFDVGDPVDVVGGATSAEDPALLALARVAVATPLVDAWDALNVLADQLLILGKIDPRKISELAYWRYGPQPTPVQLALDWARYELRDRKQWRAYVTEIDYAGGTITVGGDDIAMRQYHPPILKEWESRRGRRLHRGMGGAPLALRAKLKPWER